MASLIRSLRRKKKVDPGDKDEIKEIGVERPPGKERKSRADRTSVCDVCFGDANFICYPCDTYVCKTCSKKHKNHGLVKLGIDMEERRKMAEGLVVGLRGEDGREDALEKEKVRLLGLVDAKQKTEDKKCWITGVCGFENKHWVALDISNSSLKMFDSETNEIVRCVLIRQGLNAWDIAEIKQSKSGHSPASKSEIDVPGPYKTQRPRPTLVGLTFTREKQISLIDFNENPATIYSKINVKDHCFELDYNDDKLFALCRPNVGYGHLETVAILSVEGVPIRVLRNDSFTGNIDDIIAFEGNVYLTEWKNSKVFCISSTKDETTVHRIKTKINEPSGIGVDQDRNVFICGLQDNKVFKLTPDLQVSVPLEIDAKGTRDPTTFCFAGGKLYIGHGRQSKDSNIITVVRIT